MKTLKEFFFKLKRPPKNQLVYIVTTFIDGKVSRKFYSKSFVGNFLQILYTHLANNDSTNYVASGSPWNSLTQTRAINGSNFTTYNVISLYCNAASGVTNKGLLIGTGTTSPAPSDYVMESIIAHGSGSGQMLYQPMGSIQGCQISGSTTSMILQRLFVNNSGAQINITEVGLYTFSASNQILIFHDVFSPADEVPNGSTYRVTLEIAVTT